MRIKLIVPLTLFSAFLLTGCFGVDNDFRNVRSLVMNSVDEKFTKDIEFSVGPAGLSLARFIVSIDDSDEDAKEILKNVSGVQVGVYEKRSNKNGYFNFSFFKKIDERMKEKGWHYLVKNVEGNELTGVYVKYENDEINKLYVINISDDELNLVRVKGDLKNIVEYAIREKGMKNVSLK